MSIKSRLKKIKTQLNLDGANCRCMAAYTESWRKDEPDGELTLMTEGIPDTCPQCRKPTNKTIIIVHFTDEAVKQS